MMDTHWGRQLGAYKEPASLKTVGLPTIKWETISILLEAVIFWDFLLNNPNKTSDQNTGKSF
jgi:hypothetical protein